MQIDNQIFRSSHQCNPTVSINPSVIIVNRLLSDLSFSENRKIVMLFAVRFTDRPGSQSVREQHLESHLSWLSERGQQILVAGSLREAPESIPIAGLWIVEADNRLEVEKLYQTDPFWTNGLRESVEILHWSKAFPGKKSLV